MNERTTALRLARAAAAMACSRSLRRSRTSRRARGGEPLQILARRLRRHHQRERRGVRRDDQILGQSALEPQAGHAERAVLVVERRIDRVVAGLRHAPRHAALPAVLDLPLHRRPIGLVEQRVLVGGHHQQRHQVLEHRAAPRQQHRLATGAREQAPEGEPALLRQLALRDGDEAREARFRGEQIVVAGVAPRLADVVADGQQMARTGRRGSRSPSARARSHFAASAARSRASRSQRAGVACRSPSRFQRGELPQAGNPVEPGAASPKTARAPRA